MAINGLLAGAVLSLYACNQPTTPAGSTAEVASVNASSAAAAGMKVAYINTDTLLNNYGFFKEKQDDLASKTEKYQKEFQNRAEGLQSEFEAYDKTRGSLTINQARSKEEELMRKRDNLAQYEASLNQTLAIERNQMLAELDSVVTDYLQNYGSSNAYDLVLTYTKGSGVLYANPKFDITNEVLKGLNTEFEASKQK